jgi:two-component sensor histidine kinase
MTSELVTNAVRYGADPAADEVVELILWPADGHYWLAVSDPGDGKPALGQSGCGAEGGRGLLLVDALAGTWGVLPRAVRGKTVVAGVRLA